MDAGLAGLEAALGQAGIVFNENGAPVVASDAAPPAQAGAVPTVDVNAAPPAASQPETATASDGERMSLAEHVAALSGEVAPETSLETSTAPATPETPAAPLSERELELQQRIDELEGKVTLTDIQSKIDTRQAEWDTLYDQNVHFWDNVAPARLQQAAQQLGWSDAQLNAALLQAKDRKAAALEEFARNEARDPLMQQAYYTQPSAIDQLVQQYGLSAEDKPFLQAYAQNPDQMKALAERLGARVQMINQRDQQAKVEARTQVATHLANGFSPTAPNVSSPKAPYKFQGGERNFEEAQALAGLIFRRGQ